MKVSLDDLDASGKLQYFTYGMWDSRNDSTFTNDKFGDCRFGTATPFRGVMISRMKSPSKTVSVMDTARNNDGAWTTRYCGSWSWTAASWDNYNDPVGRPGLNHNDRSNVTFFDGHVESFGRSELRQKPLNAITKAYSFRTMSTLSM